jgi:predicted enzyme related to lactoylglutathione lyase
VIKTVMFFVNQPSEAANWWAQAMNTVAQHEGEYSFIEIGDLEIGFHPNDDGRNPQGSSTVAYLGTDDFEGYRTHFLQLGCTMHRGPLELSATRRIAQLTDPFGNVFGLDGH